MATNKTAQRSRKQAARDQLRRKAKQKRRMRTVGVAVGVALAVAAIAVAVWPEPEVGSIEAEAWDLPALEGEARLTIEDFSGTPTVAAFFASWCTVCEAEIPEFLEVSERLKGRVEFVGINTQDRGQGRGDADKWGISDSWPLARDIGRGNGSGLSVDTFGARGMPLTVIYTPEGEVAHVQRGGMSGAQLDQLLIDLFDI